MSQIKNQNSHYIPQFILRGFQVDDDSGSHFLLHDKTKGVGRKGLQFINKNDLEELFSYENLYLSRRIELTNDLKLEISEIQSVEGKLTRNETKAANIIHDIEDTNSTAPKKLNKRKRVDLGRFLTLIQMRNPFFHSLLQENSPNPAFNALASDTRSIQQDNFIPPEGSVNIPFATALARSELSRSISNVIGQKNNLLWKMSMIVACNIENDNLSYITGSFPISILKTEPDNRPYIWVPVTKKLALCLILPSDDQCLPSIKHITADPKIVGAINRFIFHCSPQVLVQSENHFDQLHSTHPPQLHHDSPDNPLFYALHDSVIMRDIQ